MVEVHHYANIIAGAFVLWACILSFHLIYKHTRNYTRPHLQRCIIRIIWMVPIYAVDSWISLVFREVSLYFDLLRDCYEAYVLYMFFTLLVNFLEGQEHEDIIEILRRKPRMKHPFPTCFFPEIRLGHSFLIWCKFCVFQFTLIKPLTTAIGLLLQIGGVYGDGSFSPKRGYLYLTIIDNLSITISMYFLVLFYKAVKEELEPFKPVPKFLCIKSIIFFSFWQGVAIAFVNYMGWIHSVGQWTAGDIGEALQNFLICIEMFIVSMAHPYIFGYEEYRNPYKEPFIRSILRGNIRENTKTLTTALFDSVNPTYDIQITRKTISATVEHTRNEMLPLLPKKTIFSTEKSVDLP